MKTSGTLVLAILVFIVPLRKADPSPLASTPEHGHPHDAHVVHPDPEDSRHQHGDEDDHHEAPNTPCHHHDTHSCSGHGSVHLLSVEDPSLNSVCWQRFVAADRYTSSDILAKKQFHVPLA